MRCGGKTRLYKAQENSQSVLSGSKNALALSAVRQNETKQKTGNVGQIHDIHIFYSRRGGDLERR